MHSASLYQRANEVQRHDAKQILEEYAKRMQWRADGLDAIVDVGCGSGNVLMELIHPWLPNKIDLLLGTDISTKMIAYAKKNYANNKIANFKVLDISVKCLPKEFVGRFDHVTSFYCLHWVQNQKNALRNIFQLLRPSGGDCLLVFLADNPIFHVYKILANHTKWSIYMKDVDKFISPLSTATDPCADYSQLLSETGFVDYSVEIRSEVFIYKGVENLKDNVRAVCPFLERIPAKEHEAFLEDVVNVIVNMNLREKNSNTMDYKFISPYKLIVVYARRSTSFLR